MKFEIRIMEVSNQFNWREEVISVVSGISLLNWMGVGQVEET